MSRIVFWGLIALIVLAPLPMAGNRPAAWTALGLFTGILLVLWAIAATRRRPRGARTADRVLLPAAILFLGALGWLLWQITGPLPADWRPDTLQRAADLLNDPGVGGSGMALDGSAAWHVLLRLLTYGGVFLLAWEFGRSRERAQAILLAVIVAGVGYALYGLVVHLAELRLVLWYPKTAYGDSLTSTFINRNSYATYAGIGLLCALALMFSEWRQRQDRLRHPIGATSSAIPSTRQELALGALALGAAALAAALLLTGSRGGFYALALAILLCLGLLAAIRLLRGRELAGIVALGVAGLAALLLSVGDTLGQRLETGAASVESSRGDLFRPTLEAILQRPLTGYGAGSFQGVFEAVNTGELYRQGYWIDKAHNTYLELALEAGIPAAIAIVLAVLLLAALCGVALVRRRSIRFSLTGVAVSLLVGLHALVDFSLQMPAIAITYAAVLGACAAQSLRRLSTA